MQATAKVYTDLVISRQKLISLKLLYLLFNTYFYVSIPTIFFRRRKRSFISTEKSLILTNFT